MSGANSKHTMTVYDSEFLVACNKLHLEDRGWLRVNYEVPAPNFDGMIRERVFAKFRTAYDFINLLLTLKNTCMATNVEVWDSIGKPEGLCLLTVETETGQVLI